MILDFVLRILNTILFNLCLVFFLGFLVVHVDHESLVLLLPQQLLLLLFILLKLIRLLPNIREVLVNGSTRAVDVWGDGAVL